MYFWTYPNFFHDRNKELVSASSLHVIGRGKILVGVSCQVCLWKLSFSVRRSASEDDTVLGVKEDTVPFDRWPTPKIHGVVFNLYIQFVTFYMEGFLKINQLDEGSPSLIN